MIFGSNITEARRVIFGTSRKSTKEERLKLSMQFIVTIVLLLIASFLFFQDIESQAASAITGAIVGYWLS